MTRSHTLLMPMLMLVMSACDDDAPDTEVAANHGSDADSGVVALKVTNVGEACSPLNRCRGGAAQCLEISYSGAYYAGGYCTADCKSSAECGPSAECPVGEAEQLHSTYDFRSTWARKCFRSCTPGNVGECRAGYACLSLAEAYEAKDAPAPMQRPVCIPRSSSMEHDAGIARLNDLDAGL